MKTEFLCILGAFGRFHVDFMVLLVGNLVVFVGFVVICRQIWTEAGFAGLNKSVQSIAMPKLMQILPPHGMHSESR